MKRLTLPMLGYLLLAGGALAQPMANDRPVVSHPAADLLPTVSPNGKWLVFVSDRDGSPGLYYQELQSAKNAIPKPLFPHPARTTSPVFSPVSDKLAFVSNREDALGDIYIADFPNGTPRRISKMGAEDFGPSFSADGKYLYYLSAPVGANAEVNVWSMSEGKLVTGVAQATTVADSAPYPVKFADEKSGYALLCADDTNNDAKLSLNDDASLWRRTATGWECLTYPIPGTRTFSVDPARGTLLLSYAANDSQEIFEFSRSPFTGLTSEQLASAADDVLTEEAPRFGLAVSLFRKAAEVAKTPHDRTTYLLRAANATNRANRFWQAMTIAEDAMATTDDEVLRDKLDIDRLRGKFFLRLQSVQLSNQNNAEELAAFTTELNTLQRRFEARGDWDNVAEIDFILTRVEQIGGRFDLALDRTTRVLDRAGKYTTEDTIARAYLQRADLYTRVQLGREIEGTLLSIFPLNVENFDLKAQAGKKLIALARAAGADDEADLLAIRSLAAKGSEHPFLQAMADLEQGRILIKLGSPDDAERVLEAGASYLAEAIRPAASAVRELAKLRISRGNHQGAIDALRVAEEQLKPLVTPATRASYDGIRNDLINTWLAKGRQEIRLSDPLLAGSTYAQLLEFDPTNVEGWRGRILALATQDDLLKAAIVEYDKERKANREDALAWYKYGLARSYVEPGSNGTRDALERATLLDPSQPYYHLTLGFVLEQQYKDGQAKGRIRKELLEQASLHDEQAIALLDRDRDPLLASDLLLNTANVALGLEQYYKADGYYAQRDAAGTPFGDQRTELLFRWNSGIAAFRANLPGRAERQFAFALQLADKLHTAGTLTQKSHEDVTSELTGRRALALMEAGKNDEARRLFTEVYDRAPANSLARVRALRNQALLIERDVNGLLGAERTEALEQARSIVAQALEELKAPTLQGDPSYAKSGGLIDFNMVFAAKAATGAAKIGFDRQDEERLLQATSARIAQLLNDRADAIAALERQKSLDPVIDDTNRAYYYSTRTVVFSRLAREAEHAGNISGAVENLLQGLRIAKFDVAGAPFANSSASTSLLLQLTELVSANGDQKLPVGDNAFWMLKPEDRTSLSGDWRLLDRAAERLLAYPLPEGKSPDVLLLTTPGDIARMKTVRSLANEAISDELFASSVRETGIKSLDLLAQASSAGLAASRFADDVLALAMATSGGATQELYRLATLTQGVSIRLAARTGDVEAATARRVIAENFARQTGNDYLLWWFRAQQGVADPDDTRAAADALAAAEGVIGQATVGASEGTALPEALFARLEERELRAAQEQGRLDELWNITERWRIARLRWLAGTINPVPAGDDDADWLAEYNRLRVAHGRLQQRLRNLAFSEATRREQTLGAMDEAAAALAAHVETGHGSDYASARFIRPVAITRDDVGAVFENPELFAEPPLLHLHRRIGAFSADVIYDADGARAITSPEAIPEGRTLFTFGEEYAAGRRVLGSLSFVNKFLRLSLSPQAEPTLFPGTLTRDALGTKDWRGALRGVTNLKFEETIEVVGISPSSWRVGELALQDIFEAANSLGAVEINLKFPADVTPKEIAEQHLALASWLDQRGLCEAVIDGERWLGILLDPARARGLATDELIVQTQRYGNSDQDGKSVESAAALENVILLTEALGAEGDLPAYYDRLADLYLKNGRLEDAVRAAQRHAELIIAKDPGGAAEARAWLAVGECATRARQWEIAEESYGKAAALYEKIGDQKGRSQTAASRAIALENAGRFPEAIEVSRRARALAENVDKATALSQELRIARIQRVYLNLYADAETTLRAVLAEAEQAGLTETTWRAKLDLARVFENTGLFDEAMDLAKGVEAEATTAGNVAMQSEALLERANISWLRADYFEAFANEQAALAKAEATDNLPVRVAAYNVSGLTSWAVNDMTRAYDELLRAMDLAQQQRVAAEIASTSNNIGLIFRSEGKYEEALGWFGRTLELDRLERNRWGQAYSLRNIGITHARSGKPADAIEPLTEAARLAAEIGDVVNLSKCDQALGDAQFELGNDAAAAESYRRALESAKAIPLPEVHWRALHGLGRVEKRAGRSAEASDLYRQAIDVVDGLRAAIRIEEFQDGFLLDKQDLYDEMVTLQLDRGEAKLALEYSERARGRNFIDLLGNRKIPLGKAGDDELVAKDRTMRTEIENLERRLGSAKEKDRPALTANLAEARQRYTDFRLLLRADRPELSTFLRVESVDIGELQKLLEPETRLLVYHTLPTELVSWVVGPDTVDVTRTKIDEAKLKDLILNTRLRLQNFEPVDADMESLGALLLPAVAKIPATVKRLGVVPHRELHALPFAPLGIGNGQVLLDRFALFYAPSASVLRYTMARRSAEMNNKVLAIGNPTLAIKGTDLPFAQKEAERLTFDFDDITVKVGEAANESWLVEHIADYGIIHIASHGEYKPDDPLFSAVMLAPDQDNDGTLSAEEIFNLQIRADLVTLSACQSGLGRVTSGDDVIGLNRAFVYAGTRQLITTLWRVDDISTAVLFKYFYRDIEDFDRAEALRQAQLKLRKRPEYRHPAHWSAAVLSGDWK